MNALIVYNTARHLYRTRRRLIGELQSSGYTVHALTPRDNAVESLEALGVRWHEWALDRHSVGALSELRSLLHTVSLVRRLRPQLCFAVTVKAVLYGGIASRLARVPRRYALIAGLGNFMMGRGVPNALVRSVYTRILRSYHGLVVQNGDDQRVVDAMLGRASRRTSILRVAGSGVDLEEFSSAKPSGLDERPALLVLMVTRLVWDKGIREFFALAKSMRVRSDIRFRLAGGLDSNPGSPSKEEVSSLAAQSGVEVTFDVSDVPVLLQQADLFVYPSYYPEGIPRALIEAAACGLPIITTDAVGCREAVIPGESGLLVPPRDAQALEAALQRLANDPALRSRMGRAARADAERRFSEAAIAKAMADFVAGSGAVRNLEHGVGEAGAP